MAIGEGVRLKKVVAVCLTMAIMMLGFATTATAAVASDFVVVCNDTYVNLRTGPGTGYGIIGSYNRGEWLSMHSESGNWYYVTGPDGKTGYVSKAFAETGGTRYIRYAIVQNPKTSSFLNLRAQPNYNARVIDYFYNGVPLCVIGGTDGWVQVEVNGLSGYVRQEFVSYEMWLNGQSVATISTPNNSGLNLRNGPGTGYGVLGQYRGGNYVLVLAKGSKWSEVCVQGNVGFMDNSYLRFEIVKPSGGGSGGGGDYPVPQPSGKPYGTVNNPISTQLLNLRETPNLSARVVGRYMNGTRVSILRQGSEWCEVSVDKTGARGYMMTKYLKLYNALTYPTAMVVHPMRSFVNLRKSPTMTSGVLVRVPHGKKVDVLSPGDGWYKVKYNGTVGYMVEDFLSK